METNKGVIRSLMGTRKKLLLSCLLVVLLLSASAIPVSAFGTGAQGPDVYAVQGMLKSLGFLAGPITGYYDSNTVDGVKYFQKTYGLRVTGAVDHKTLESILWAYANAKLPKKAPPSGEGQVDKGKRKEGKAGKPQISPEEQQMVDLVNGERTKVGLQPLAVDAQLTQIARLKSQDMIGKKYFSHQSPTYGSPFDMLKQFGVDYSHAGENIACNRSVEEAHKSLMNSQGHRENILSGNYNTIGIGIVDGGPCGKMFTQTFVGK